MPRRADGWAPTPRRCGWPRRRAARSGCAAPPPTGRATGATAARWSSARSARRLQAINALGLEDYVRGVVSAESPSTWPAEALKAQAVAARTYAVTTNVGTTTDGIDQYADTRSQMYKGVAAEYPSTDAAVAATAGQVVAQNGKPVTTYFFSTSGGHTENVEDSFIGALPRTWLKGVDDPFDAVSPRHNWGPFTFSQATVQAKLKGLVRGSFRGITVLERGASPRIVRAEVDGTNGVTQVTGPQLRTRLGLFDTWATFTYISGSKKQSSDDDGGGKKTEQPVDHRRRASTSVPGATISPDSGGATPPAAGDGTGGGGTVAVGAVEDAGRCELASAALIDPDSGRRWCDTSAEKSGPKLRFGAELPIARV